MSTKTSAPCGSWLSHLDPEAVNNIGTTFSHMLMPLADDGLIWLEHRAKESGRGVLVCGSLIQSNGYTKEINDTNFDVRSRVHEYGGGDFAINEEFVWFANTDGAIICHDLVVHTNTVFFFKENHWFADFIGIDEGELICIEEERPKQDSSNEEPHNRIVFIDKNACLHVLVEGASFYASIAFCSTTKRLAWLQWSHPDMPWDSGELWVSDFIDYKISNPTKIAGGYAEQTTSACLQPVFDTNGILYFLDDKSNNWALYQETDLNTILGPHAGECGFPLWQLGMKSYAITNQGIAVMAVCQEGLWHLEALDLDNQNSKPIKLDLPFVQFKGIINIKNDIAFVSASEDQSPAIIQLKIERTQDKKFDVCWHDLLKHNRKNTFKNVFPIKGKDISLAQKISFDSIDGKAFAFFYPPANTQFEPLYNELPPLIVRCHGGPTAQADLGLSFKTQFWTNRGFAVLEVNYRGSTGFGRCYRQALEKQWGVLDVEDACAGAKYLVQNKQVDPNRLIISGSSAGGYSVLAALAFHDVFHAGCSAYGIGDLIALAQSTHKFERYYLNKLIAELPEGLSLYAQRSPAHNPQGLNCPVLFLQGLKDQVVPPSQARQMAQILDQKNIPHGTLFFPDEGHGFRNSDNIKKALLAELWFYGAVFGFTPQGDSSNLKIMHRGLL